MDKDTWGSKQQKVCIVMNKGPSNENIMWSKLVPAQKTKKIFERQRHQH